MSGKYLSLPLQTNGKGILSKYQKADKSKTLLAARQAKSSTGRSKQRRILIFPEGIILAHVGRSLKIAKALKSFGHRIEFATAGNYSSLISNEGFYVHPVFTMEKENALKRLRHKGIAFDDQLLSKYVSAEVEIIERASPDLVVGDFRMSLGISSEIMGVPYVCVTNACWTNYYSAKLKAPESFVLSRLIGQNTTNILAPLLMKPVTWYYARMFNRYRKQKRLPWGGNIFDVMCSRDLTLMADIPEFAPTHHLPPNFKYIGPVVWEPEVEAPEWVARLNPEKPIIYFSMGSTGDPKCLNVALDLCENTDYQIIATTAGLVRPSRIVPNSYLAEFLPGSTIMKKANLVICHGGNGTIYQALSSGVPIIGIPTFHDQEFNMDRVQDLRLGIKLSQRNFGVSSLKKAIDTILADSEYGKKAKIFEQILDRHDPPLKGATLIHEFLNGI